MVIAYSVIVPVRGALIHFAEAASALEGLGSGSTEVIVVDDANHDADAQLVAAIAHRFGFKLIRSDRRLWFPGAVNLAAAAASGERLVVLNSDTVPPRSIIASADRCLSDSGVAIVGWLGNAAGYQSVPWNPDASGPYPICELPALHDPLSMSCAVEALGIPGPIDVPWVNGFAFAMRRSSFMSAGMFDVGAFPAGYGEEIDLCLRLALRGERAVVDPSCFVFHAKTRSYRADERRMFIEQGHIALHARYGESTILHLRELLRRNAGLAAARRAVADLYSRETR